MRERGSGHIVTVATIGVDFPPLRWSAYIASKTAFETWLAGVAPEIRADGVTTTSIHLQIVRSPMPGPFRIWNFVPAMSSDEAAGIVARAIVQRPRTIAPVWARLGSAATDLAQEPLEAALALYSRFTNPDSRRRAAGSPGSGAGGFGLLGTPLRVAEQAVGGLSTVASARVLRPIRPDRGARALLALRRFGPGPGFVAAAAAELYRDRPAVIDELGTLSFGELDRQARALAGAMYRTCELDCDDRVAIMCRNHRGFVLAAVAASRLGCDLVPVGTDFSGPELREVLDREGVTVVVCDDEFEQVFDAAGFAGPLIIAWSEQESGLSGEPGSERESERPTIEALLESGAGDAFAPARYGRVVMLTSGTTGTPRGATRNLRVQALLPLVVDGLIDLLRIKRTPRSGQPIVVAPPLFHLFGIAGLMAAFGFGSPVVLSRRFDPERTLEQIAEHRAEVLLAVPTMLGRIMDMPSKLRDRYDCSSLRMLISGAAPLTPVLAAALLEQFGDVLYNGYASTEIGAGTIATPADLRAAPGTVGRPVAGVTVKILDQQGDELPRGETGACSWAVRCSSRATPAGAPRR
jgi:AMP-binding enzyme/short chain dehydrogenase